MESRQHFSTVVINSLTDAPTVSGSVISLRAAIAIANASSAPTTITFDPGLFATPQTIMLTNGGLTFSNTSQPTTIIGPAAGAIINANQQSDVLAIDVDTVATLSNLTVTGGNGGGIINAGNVTVTNVTISGNSGGNGGGFINDGNAPQYGFFPDQGIATLTDDTISGNTATAGGGGIFNSDNSGLTITNCTIYRNSASSTNGLGGGLLNQNGAVVTITDSTISGNSASAFNNEDEPLNAGGGVFNAFATLTLGNSIVAGNTTESIEPDVGVFIGGGTIGSSGNNFIGISDPIGAISPFLWLPSDQVGSSLTPIYPQLGVLADNGGLTQTLIPLTGSPVIDTGSNALIPTGITTDQRGLPRVVNGTVDIGAVETQPSSVSPPVDLMAGRVTAGIALSWSSSAGASGMFDVYRGNFSTGESGTPLAVNITGTGFTDPNSDLVSGHDYYYTVTQISGSQQSTASNEAAALAPGPYIAPAVEYPTGFPASAQTAFTDPTTRTFNSFNSNGTISIGGSLQYSAPVSANHFFTNFQFLQPAGFNGAFDLSAYLETSGGAKVGIFNAGAAAVALLAIGGDTYSIQLTYDGKTLTVNIEDPNYQTGNPQQHFSVQVNLPAAISSSLAYMTFVADEDNDPVLNSWQFSNSVLTQPAPPQITANPNGIVLQGFGPGTDIYRGTTSGGESTTPIAVDQNSEYLDASAIPGITYYYVIVSTAPGSQDSAASSEVSAIIQSQTPAMLTGTPIGTAAAWNPASTIYAAFDGKLNTFFDPANSKLSNWVGLDLGENATITRISYAPRAGSEFRMLGGQFQVSSSPDFSTNVKTIFTISSIPVAGMLTSVSVNPGAGYRYIRYTGGTQWVNIAELQVTGLELPLLKKPVSFQGKPIGVGGAWLPGTSGVAQAFDGNLNTYFDPANGNLSNWAGLDLGKPELISRISYAPRAGYEFRMVGGQFQVSSSPNFSSDVHTLYTITKAPVAGRLTTVVFPSVGSYRYVRYVGGNQWVNIAEMDVAGPVPPITLTGTAIGTAGAYSAGSGINAAFDGQLATFFDPANNNLTNWVGQDLGSARVVTQIRFAPRAGYEFRMVGGMFQASNTANFSTGVVTLATITSAPAAGKITTISVNPTDTAYRYFRYTGGTQWVNVAELEFDGLA